MNFLSLFVLIIFISTPLFAFRVTPMVVEFAPSGKDATQTFTVENGPGNANIAIEVEATKRVHDLEGEEKRDSVEDFSIYPLQFSMAPNSKRSIRVTYNKGEVPFEKAYRIIFRQLPVDLNKETKKGVNAQINFIFEYVASVYVAPKDIFPKIETISLKKVGNSLEAMLHNTGTKHALIKEMKVVLKNKKSEHLFNSTELGDLEARNILAKDKAKILFPYPQGLEDKELQLIVSPK